MATIEANAANFNEITEREGIVFLDFWAEWCGPCKMFGPTFEAAAEKNEDITFAKVNTEEQTDIAAALRTHAIPTLMALRDGVLVFRQPGALPGEAFEQLIQAVRDLDMDEVRAEIAAKEAEAAQAQAQA